jgi:hypothetical protein
MLDDLHMRKGLVDRTLGRSRPLKELAPGDRMSVHVLIGPASGARIEEELGYPAVVMQANGGAIKMTDPDGRPAG